MADLFPYEMVNVTDLAIERVTSFGDYSVDGPRTSIGTGLRAIVARTQDVIKSATGADFRLLADLYLPPGSPTILRGDRASWSDFQGSISDEEVQEVEPWSMGGDTFGIRVRVGQRVA